VRQFKTLLLKEWHTYKKTFLIPLWVLLVHYGLGIIAFAYGAIRFGLPNFVNLDSSQPGINVLLWGLHYGAAIFLAWLSLLTSISLADVCLNQDYQKRCEIFHLSQPVSLLKIMGTKAAFVSVAVFIEFIVLILVNYLIIGTISFAIGYPSFTIGLGALINATVYMLKASILLIPLVWFFSSMFRKTPAVKLLLFFAIYESIRLMLKLSWGLETYSIFGFWNRVVFTPFEVITKISMKTAFVPIDFTKGSLNSYSEQMIWLAINVLLITASYFIYKRRNVS